MSTSSAAPTTRPANDQAETEVSDSVTNNDEEMMEVEEAADSSNSPNNVAQDGNGCKEMESVGHNSYLGLGSSTQERFKARQPYDILAVLETKGFSNSDSSNKLLKRLKEESHVSHEHYKYPKSGKQMTFSKENGSQESEISKKNLGAFPRVKTTESQHDLHSDLEAHFCNSKGAETTSPSSVARKNVAIVFPVEGCLGEGTSEEETKQMDMHSGDDKQRMASRLASSAIRTRSLSPGTEIKVGNKRPAVVCDFFSKGWCIKGNSCRFLHVKDETNSTSLQTEQDVDAISMKAESQIEGLSNITDRSRLYCFPDPPATSARNNSSFSPDLFAERMLPQELGESKRLAQFQENHRFSFHQRESISLGNPSSSQQLASSRDDVGVMSSLKDVHRDSLRQNWSADDYGNRASMSNGGSSPIFKNSLLHEHRSSPSQFIRNNYLSLSHSLNSMSTSGPTGGSLPPHHISAWTGSAVPFNSSCLNASPLGPQKLLDSDRQCRTSISSSMLRSSSPFSGSEPEKPRLSADYKTKVSSNDWEPSVPFRPSFHIDLTSISSSGCQYDSLHHSFDSPKLGESLKVSLSSVRASSLNMPHQQIYGDSTLSRTIVSESNGDNSVSSHDRFQENVLEKDCQTPGKDSHTAGEEAVGTSFTDVQNESIVKEDDPSVSTSVKDISKSNKIHRSHYSRDQNDGSRRDKDLKIDRVKQSNDMDIEHKTDGDVHKESKIMRHFRAGLVDLVKELLKPTWREGKLSKDAHNRIVKKAVDKVLSALQPHQIPTTVESVKQYLSSSQPKIAKLIEGYVDKYGKS